jgi:hypothetical protein
VLALTGWTKEYFDKLRAAGVVRDRYHLWKVDKHGKWVLDKQGQRIPQGRAIYLRTDIERLIDGDKDGSPDGCQNQTGGNQP